MPRKLKPNKETLIEDLERFKNLEKCGEYYGVSSSAIRKWCRSYGVNFRLYADHGKYEKKLVKCKCCGKIFESEYHPHRKKYGLFCSEECRRSYSILDLINNKDEIYDRYFNKNESLRSIGDHFGHTHCAIGNFIIKNFPEEYKKKKGLTS